MEAPTLKQKMREVNDILEQEFGIPERREYEDVLSCLVRTILSQNTNDANSSRAYQELRRRFPTWEDVLSAQPAEVAEAIRIGGLANQKSATIHRLLRWVKEERGKLDLDFLCALPTEEAVRLLSAIKGIGIKTIFVTLNFACGQEVFPVDTHILRVGKRLGFLPPNASADRAHAVLGKLCPSGKAFSLHVNLIRFGRQICHARQPDCPICPLIEHCVWIREPF